MSGIRDITVNTMILARTAGATYWKKHRPMGASAEGLETLARSCGWHNEDCTAWLAGFYGAKHKEDMEQPEYSMAR